MLPPANVVVAGLVPAIHVFLLRNPQQERRCRHKAGHDETNFQYAPVLSASLLVCTRPRLFSILPSTIAKSLRSCAERQERICCSLRFSRGISSSYSALPFRVMRSWNSRRAALFSTGSPPVPGIRTGTAG